MDLRNSCSVKEKYIEIFLVVTWWDQHCVTFNQRSTIAMLSQEQILYILTSFDLFADVVDFLNMILGPFTSQYLAFSWMVRIIKNTNSWKPTHLPDLPGEAFPRMVMVVLGQHLHNATRALAEEMAEHGSAGTLGPDVATWKERRVINEFPVALRLFVRSPQRWWC